MFAYLEGKLTWKSPSMLHLDVQGVGYELNISLQTYDKVQLMERVRLYTHLQIREDAWTLYGFADDEERATFRQLLSINGVGAVTARIILSSLSIDELERAINSENVKALEKVKGIGAKTAQRIILELKGKILRSGNSTSSTVLQHNTKQDDALIALVNLGISKAMADSAVRKLGDTAGMTVEEIIKQALRAL